jgi:hypothetical protein
MVFRNSGSTLFLYTSNDEDMYSPHTKYDVDLTFLLAKILKRLLIWNEEST